MTEIVRRVPGTTCPSRVREASARLHDLPGVRSVTVGATWTELVVHVDSDLPSADVEAVACFPLIGDDR